MPLVILIMGLAIVGLAVSLHEQLVEVTALKTEVHMLRERYEPVNTSDEK